MTVLLRSVLNRNKETTTESDYRTLVIRLISFDSAVFHSGIITSN